MLNERLDDKVVSLEGRLAWKRLTHLQGIIPWIPLRREYTHRLLRISRLERAGNYKQISI